MPHGRSHGVACSDVWLSSRSDLLHGPHYGSLSSSVMKKLKNMKNQPKPKQNPNKAAAAQQFHVCQNCRQQYMLQAKVKR